MRVRLIAGQFDGDVFCNGKCLECYYLLHGDVCGTDDITARFERITDAKEAQWLWGLEWGY